MFCAVSLDDYEVAKKITLETGGVYNDNNTMHLVFILEDRVSGIASARYNGRAIRIDYVGLVESTRGKGFGDFLTRSIINKVMDLAEVVEVNSTSDYFLKFGFKKVGDIMVAKSSDIVFPSICKH